MCFQGFMHTWHWARGFCTLVHSLLLCCMFHWFLRFVLYFLWYILCVWSVYCVSCLSGLYIYRCYMSCLSGLPFLLPKSICICMHTFLSPPPSLLNSVFLGSIYTYLDSKSRAVHGESMGKAVRDLMRLSSGLKSLRYVLVVFKRVWKQHKCISYDV